MVRAVAEGNEWSSRRTLLHNGQCCTPVHHDLCTPRQADHYNKELKNKNLELDSQRVQLEEANIKFAQTDSMLLSCQGELSSKKTELWMKDTELKNIKGQVRVFKF